MSSRSLRSNTRRARNASSQNGNGNANASSDNSQQHTNSNNGNHTSTNTGNDTQVQTAPAITYEDLPRQYGDAIRRIRATDLYLQPAQVWDRVIALLAPGRHREVIDVDRLFLSDATRIETQRYVDTLPTVNVGGMMDYHLPSSPGDFRADMRVSALHYLLLRIVLLLGPANEVFIRRLLTGLLFLDPFAGLPLSTAGSWTAPPPSVIDRYPPGGPIIQPDPSTHVLARQRGVVAGPLPAATTVAPAATRNDDDDDDATPAPPAAAAATTTEKTGTKRKRAAADVGGTTLRRQSSSSLPPSSTSSSSLSSALTSPVLPVPALAPAPAPAPAQQPSARRLGRNANHGAVVGAVRAKGKTGLHAPPGQRYLCDQPAVNKPGFLCKVVKQKTQDMSAHLRQVHGFPGGRGATYPLGGMGPFTAAQCKERRPDRNGGYKFTVEEDERRVAEALERRRVKAAKEKKKEVEEEDEDDEDDDDEDEEEEK